MSERRSRLSTYRWDKILNDASTLLIGLPFKKKKNKNKKGRRHTVWSTYVSLDYNEGPTKCATRRPRASRGA